MIEYIVNEEKRTVVAMIKLESEEGDPLPTFKHSDLVFNDLWLGLNRLKFSVPVWDKNYYIKYNKMYFPKLMSAKAKCNPEDEWDEEYGKALARMRLVEKIKKYRSDSYKIISDLNKEIADVLNK